MDKDIKTEIVKELKEEKEVDFSIKCEICNEISDTENVCVHYKNGETGNVEQKQDNKLQESCLFSANNVHKNSDVRIKIEKTDCSCCLKHEDCNNKLVDADITIKKEQYLDNPEYLSINIDSVESPTGQVKTEDDVDLFHENANIAKIKEEPTDNKAVLTSNMLVQDEISIVDVKPDFEETQEGFEMKLQTDYKFTTGEVIKKHFSNTTTRNRTSIPGIDLNKEKPHRCTFCSKTYSKNCLLIIHERVHTGENPFQCNVCSRWFSSKYLLRSHQKTHTGKQPFKCKTCSKCFSHSSSLVTHQRTHTGGKQFHCRYCSKSFAYLWNMVTHEKIHSGEKPHVCKVCSKSFVWLGHLITHERIHSGEKPYKCGVCSKSFSNISALGKHKQIHSEEKPSRCDICSKSFSNISALGKHKQIHSEEKPFRCDICSKYFTVKSYLLAHQKIHEIPVECNASVQNGNLKEHMQKKVHLLLRKKSENESGVEIAVVGTL